MSDGFTLAKQSEVFKTNYDKKSENMYNSKNVLAGRRKKRYDFTGNKKTFLTPLSFAGGVGSGRLPKANSGNYKQAEITSNRVYGVCEIEREAIHASANDKGAFLRATAETVKQTVSSYMRNDSRILFGDGSAVLGRGDGTGADVTGTGADEAHPFIVTIPASEWQESSWEEEDYVQMVTSGVSEGGDAETNLLRVLEVVPATRQVKLVGVSPVLTGLVAAPAPLAANHEIAMQRSYNKDPLGLDSVVKFSEAGTGSLYGINYQRRWRMNVQDKAGRGINTDMMNGIMLEIERTFGQVPNMIMASYVQLQNILALLEDKKVYNLPNKNVKGHMGFNGVEFMSTRGPIGIFVDRFCPDDRVYFLNDNYIETHHRPGFGWFTEDKTVFLRLQDDDAYGARYGGYLENFITPTAHGVLKGLAV